MSSKSDREWQLQITALVAEVKSTVDGLHSKVDDHIVKSDKRFDKLDKIVIGNGQPGLAEEVRGIKGKWGMVYTTLLLGLNALTTWGITIWTK